MVIRMSRNRKNIIFLIFLNGLIILSLLGRVCYGQVSISPGTWITLKEGGSLMIGTGLHIKSVADSSGYFVDQTIDGDVTITGDIAVDRYLKPDIWHNIASPVNNELSSVFTGTDLVFWYDETQIWNDWNFGWIWYYGATGGPLMTFRGYDVYYDSNPATVTFSGGGVLNTGPYTYNITITDPTPNPMEIPSHLGWNFAGNPYPCPVDWLASGWDKSDINDAKYIWDGVNELYTIFEGGSSPIGTNGGTRYIPSNQGFWVQAVQNGSISINNAVRLGDMTGTPDFYKSQKTDYPLVSLVASGNDRSDEIIIRFIEGTTERMDINYDASKLFSYAEYVPQLAIISGRQVLAISTLPEIGDELPVALWFQCGKEGYYTLKLSPRTNLDETTGLYLKDELLQKMINLKNDSSYMFYHNPRNDKNRFILYFNPSEDLISLVTPENWFSVYSSGNQISVIKNTSKEISGEMIIYDLLGRPVFSQGLPNRDLNIISPNLPSGYYIVSIECESHRINAKVLIH